MGKHKTGTKVTTHASITPKWAANRKAVVITWQEFKKGALCCDSRFNWTLDKIRNATFIRYLDGPKAGKVDMSDDEFMEAAP